MTNWEPKPNVPWDSRWRPVPDFPNYYISQYGQVFNMKRMQLMSLYRNTHNVLCVRMYQKSVMGSRGHSRSVNKLLEAIFPREAKMDDLEPMTLQDEIEAMRLRLEDSPDGSYFIPGIKFSDRNPTVRNLHTLMSRLSFYFPQYVWITHDSMFPENTGVRVEWRRKPEVVKQTPTTTKEITNA